MKWLPRPANVLPEIEPLAPVTRPKPFDDPAFLFEPAYRGHRALLYVRHPGVWFQSAAGGIAFGFDTLALGVRQHLLEDILILDGVVIALDGDGKQDRRSRLSGGSQLHYAAFDVIWRGRQDLRRRPLWWRKLALEELIPRSGPILSRVYAVPEQGRALYRAAERLHYGGIVAKRRSDPYQEGAVWYQIRTRAPR
jgi:hypothetical protein